MFHIDLQDELAYLRETEKELKKYKLLYNNAQSELTVYKNLYEQSQETMKSYETKSKYQQRQIIHLSLVVAFVLILALVAVFIPLRSNPAEDVVRIKPTATVVKSFSALSSFPSATARSKPVEPTAKPTSTPKPTAKPISVWIPASGRCYHDSKSCAGSAPTLVAIDEAKRRGYTRCGRCKPPR